MVHGSTLTSAALPPGSTSNCPAQRLATSARLVELSKSLCELLLRPLPQSQQVRCWRSNRCRAQQCVPVPLHCPAREGFDGKVEKKNGGGAVGGCVRRRLLWWLATGRTPSTFFVGWPSTGSGRLQFGFHARCFNGRDNGSLVTKFSPSLALPPRGRESEGEFYP
jgi:hypothetical protein